VGREFAVAHLVESRVQFQIGLLGFFLRLNLIGPTMTMELNQPLKVIENQEKFLGLKVAGA